MGPNVVIEGLEDILERDIAKHKMILERSKGELDSYNQALTYQIKKKKFYSNLLKDKDTKYKKSALKKSRDMIAIDIRQISDKIKLTKENITHHTHIVDTLTQQLADQKRGLTHLNEQRKKEIFQKVTKKKVVKKEN